MHGSKSTQNSAFLNAAVDFDALIGFSVQSHVSLKRSDTLDAYWTLLKFCITSRNKNHYIRWRFSECHVFPIEKVYLLVFPEVFTATSTVEK